MFQQPYREKYFTGDELSEWPLKIAEFFLCPNIWLQIPVKLTKIKTFCNNDNTKYFHNR